VYLEPVFGRGALPSEQGRLKRVEDDFRESWGGWRRSQGHQGLRTPRCSPTSRRSSRAWWTSSERCQRALSDFLEERRSRFPRFYFIGDDDMLEILGQSQNPAVIQSHLKKLYQGVHRVEFSKETAPSVGGKPPTRQIIAMCSASGEVVQLAEPVTVTDDVTVWLNKLTAAMVSTLTASLVACCRSQDPWESKLRAYSFQIHCLSEQVWFSAAAEAALDCWRWQGARGSEGAAPDASIAVHGLRCQQGCAFAAKGESPHHGYHSFHGRCLTSLCLRT